MQMSEKLAKAFAEQVTMELASSIAYLQMSAWFDSTDLPGMALWMRIQANEERDHGLKLMDFMLDRRNYVEVGAIGPPAASFDSPQSVFEAALEQERSVSRSIRDLYLLATAEKDVESYPLLEWFLTEQIEEEKIVQNILGQLGYASSDGSALLLLDRELGARSTVP